MFSRAWILSLLLAVGVMIAAFVTYLPTLAPTISWRNGGTDGGDLATAVATLGIPHPPGYPAYVLLGRAWTALPLGGDIAYRLNLLSATGAALAAGLSTLTIFLLGRKLALAGLPLAIGAVLGGLFLALAPLTWLQATITEVYAPGLAMLSLFTLLLWAGQKAGANLGGRAAGLFLVGLLGGLGLGVLPQLVLVLPGALGWLYFNQKHRLRPDWGALRQAGRQFIPLLAGVSLGLSIFIYLPLRAVAQPMVNWGDPSTPTRFWEVVTAAQYRYLVGASNAGEWFQQVLYSFNRLGQDLSWAGVGLAGLGSYALWRYDRPALGYLLSLGGLTLLFQTNYAAVENNLVYLLPVLYGLALLAGIGAAWLLALAKDHLGSAGATLLGLGLVATLSWRAMNLAPLLDASADRQAALFGQQTLATLPPDALLISERDETTFSLWYRQALGERPDVVVVDKRLLFYDWYQRNLLQRYPDLSPTAVKPGQLINLDRPIYVLAGPPGEEVAQPLITIYP